VIVLGIESSCDETAASVVDGGRVVRSSVVASQDELHAPYGGIVPEVAGREHVRVISAIIREAIARAGIDLPQIDAVAVTNRPGLIGSLLVGVAAAKALAFAIDRPLIGVDHVEAHIVSTLLGDEPLPAFPAVALIVSGGHTNLFRVDTPGLVQPLGATVDDAAGEAFDKVAKILGLGYPGGPEVERRARDGNPAAYDLPRARMGDGTDDFSFSGLKTAVLYRAKGQNKKSSEAPLRDDVRVEDMAASFQAAVLDVLVSKTMDAARREGVKSVLAGGGVTANGALRAALSKACDAAGLDLRLPGPGLATDNAAMIAAAGHYRLEAGETDGLDLEASPRRAG